MSRPIDHVLHPDGIAEVVMAQPPVNALRAAQWTELAELITDLGSDLAVRVVLPRAEGPGFNAGVDIKEIQQAEGFAALVAASRGYAQAFAAVHRCEVPAVAAVHGHCLGGGIGLVGNADIVLASDDATFGLPEVDRGALGAATHLARLVPHHALRLQLRDNGKRMPVNDSWIAATAMSLNVPVVTQDSDYVDIQGLQVIKV